MMVPEYAGKTERDDDEEPKGNGSAGDRLTAFEECTAGSIDEQPRRQ